MFLYISDLSKREVSGEESAHWWSLRPKVGQMYTITDLQGSKAVVEIQEVQKTNQRISFHIQSITKLPPKPPRILFQAITDKIYLDKMVEVLGVLGVEQIYLFEAQNSIKLTPNITRLQKIILRSNEQSQQVWGTRLDIINTNQLWSQAQHIRPVVLELSSKSISKPQNSESTSKYSVLIGPEGGWSGSEVNTFNQHNLNFYSLGEAVYPSWLSGFVYFSRILS